MRNSILVAAILVGSGCSSNAVDDVALFPDLRPGPADSSVPLDTALFDSALPDAVMVDSLAARDSTAPPVDAARPDLSTPDLSTPDLSTPDLATPDLSTPDLAMPDLAMPDLAKPDLTAPTCSDGVRNGNESDIDCGGGTCPACGVGKSCSASSDCEAGELCGTSSRRCQALQSCKDVLSMGTGSTSGVYKLDPCSTGAVSDYYCDQTSNGGGFTIGGWQSASAATSLGISDRGVAGDPVDWSRNLKCIAFTQIAVFNRTFLESYVESYPASTWSATATNFAIGAAGVAFKQGTYGGTTMMGCVDYSYQGAVHADYACDTDSYGGARGHIADYAGEYCPGGRLDLSGKLWAWTDGRTCTHLHTDYTWGFGVR